MQFGYALRLMHFSCRQLTSGLAFVPAAGNLVI